MLSILCKLFAKKVRINLDSKNLRAKEIKNVIHLNNPSHYQETLGYILKHFMTYESKKY